MFTGLADPDLEGRMPSEVDPMNMVHFFEYEFLLGSTYNPDWRKIVENGVSVGVLAGKRSGDAFYVKAAREQATVLGCRLAFVAGHHAGFEVEPEAFREGLVGMIEQLELEKHGEGK